MKWYTVRLNKYQQKLFFTFKAALEFIEDFKEKTDRTLIIIERRTNGDTEKPETYT